MCKCNGDCESCPNRPDSTPFAGLSSAELWTVAVYLAGTREAMWAGAPPERLMASLSNHFSPHMASFIYYAAHTTMASIAR